MCFFLWVNRRRWRDNGVAVDTQTHIEVGIEGYVFIQLFLPFYANFGKFILER